MVGGSAEDSQFAPVLPVVVGRMDHGDAEVGVLRGRGRDPGKDLGRGAVMPCLEKDAGLAGEGEHLSLLRGLDRRRRLGGIVVSVRCGGFGGRGRSGGIDRVMSMTVEEFDFSDGRR